MSDTQDVLMRYANDIVLLLDEQARIIDCNDRAPQALRYRREDLIGMSLADIRVAEADIPLDERLAANRAAGAEGTVFEGEARRSDGSTFPTEVSVRTVETPDGLVYHASLRDISERRAVQAAMIESEERYRLLFESMMEGSAHCRMLFDEEGRPDDWVYLSANPAFDRLTGIDDPAGKRVTELFPTIKADNPELLETYGRVVTTGEPAEFDIDFGPLGKWLHVSASRPRAGEFVAFFYDVSDRIKATHEAVEAREALRRSLDAAGMATWDWDLRSGRVTWTDESWDLYGIERDGREPSFDLWIGSIHPDDRERISHVAWRGAHEGTEHEISWRVDTKDGSERWLLSRGGPRRDEQGRVTHYGGVVFDVTQRRLAERRAEESERRLRLSLQAAGAGTWEWDLVTGVNTWSDEIWPLYDLDPEAHKASYESWLESVHPDDRDEAAAAVAAASENGDEVDIEYRVNTRDGSVRWLISRGSPERDDEGNPVRYLGVVVDVTERKLATISAREREESYAVIFDRSPFAMALMTDDSRVVEANEAFLELMGGSREAIVGRTVVELGLAPSSDVAGLTAALKENGSVRDVELSRTSLDARPFIVALDLTRVTIEGRDYVLAIYRDITEQKRAEEVAQRERNKLDAALASMTDAVFISDLEGNFVDFNLAFATFHRFSDKESCATTLAEYPEFLDVSMEDGSPAPLDMWAVPRALRGEVGIDVVYGLRRKDTSEEWMGSYSFGPIRDEAGEIIGSVVVGRDITDRVRTDRERRESEEKFRSLFEHSPLALFFSEPDGAIYDANAAAQAMFRRTEDELVALGRDGILDASDSRMAVALAVRDRTGHMRAVELTGMRAGGERFPVEVDSIILPGDPPRSFVMMRDITERREMERALRESEAQAREMVERLSRAQQLGHIGDWEWDVATGEVRWSDEVYRIYGVGPDFPTSFETIVPMMHPDDRDADLRAAAAILDDPRRSSGALRFRIIRPDGEVRHVLQTLAVERDGRGVALRVFGLQQDVTELREAEQALVKSEHSLRRFYEAGLVGVVYWVAEGAVTDANDRFLEMLGYTRDELEAGLVDWVRMTPPEWAPRDQECMEELRATGRNASPFEKEYYRRDGSRIPILVAAATLDEAGTTGIALVLDISEQKRARDELRRLNAGLEQRVRRRTADLEAANAELESFAYSVSHDLRAPLRHISGFATLLGERLDSADEEMRHFIDRITQSAAGMSVLIDDLLQLSRIGRAEMHIQRVDMESLAREVLEIEGTEQGERRVQVEVGEVLPAKGDALLLRQVWANLVGNAFKYTRPRDPAVIALGSRREGDEVVYWVRDNGVGFDMQYADRLFRVFERLHRSDEFEGTGIGLANVERILGRHDGRCWVESQVGEGATFFFALPRG